MRRTAEFLASLVLITLLAAGGSFVVTRSGVPIPGPVVGLIVYSLLLFLGFLGWTTPAAGWLSGLLGALIVPPLVGVAAFAPDLAAGGWRLAVALVVGTVVTAVVFRVAGGEA